MTYNISKPPRPPIPEEVMDELDALLTRFLRVRLEAWMLHCGYLRDSMVCRAEQRRGTGGNYWTPANPYKAEDVTYLELKVRVVRDEDAQDPIFLDDEDTETEIEPVATGQSHPKNGDG